ncbi:CheR family methyltransferase [Thermocaproicibacter melissae]|jgi:chemotaxis protein methyltransferase CheR|uniref:CheR family methyltransferase n=1 Tax=Thermocaproicibacter melissae TaxID=2966552 RepID=UPI0024B106A5|nr:protein-glutamate O-methyltransferase CheR [Thermocaproicibacter melissae]WBY64348.1 protein-glutamate O-methyltransferase CheR [Thermocaproicibacter melissae]
MIQLTDDEFSWLVTYIRNNYGIDLSKKRLLIEARMYSVLVKHDFTSFSQYFSYLKQNENELNTLLNKLTTNHTYFMREPRHFDFLREVILPQQLKENREHSLRIWSAGCSTGEEAYTAVMTMKDFFRQSPGWDTRILATDISTKVLAEAQQRVYSAEDLQNLPESWKRLYFTQSDDVFLLKDEIRREVIFRRLNLMEDFHFQRPFDLIFCRNVMIYFTKEAKDSLIRKFCNMLKPGGYLFIGHSENIQNEVPDLHYVEPSIYQKGRLDAKR